MAKKKATMTLKDFHGGSIPSDISLPSAPGIIVRSSERASFDRQAAWVNSMGRSDHRSRPGLDGTARNFDDKTPFLSYSNHIGRNFDEDERKPLDGVSGPHRKVSDESLVAPPTHVVEPNSDFSERVPSQPSSNPGSQYTSSSYAGRFTEVNNVGVGSQGFEPNSGVAVNYQNVSRTGRQMVSEQHPNASGFRKDAAGIKEPVPVVQPAPDTAAKLAHASALEKVSSGRWLSKQHSSSQPDVEVIRQPEVENKFHLRDQDVVVMTEYPKAALVRPAEKNLIVDDRLHGGGNKDVSTYERDKAHVTFDAKERVGNVNGFQLLHHPYKPGGAEMPSVMHSELSERPKLKLLPRSKPLENQEPPMEQHVVYQQPTVPVHLNYHSQSHGIPNPPKASVGSESGNPIIECSKLNLEPRSDPLVLAEDDTESKRNTLFGGARPRELVLKELGSDDVTVSNNDLARPPLRIKQDVLKTDKIPVHATSNRYNDKPENVPIEHRTGKNPDRQDHRLEVERTDVQRRNWRGENWRNKRDFEKQQLHQQLQLQERPSSPETWRKPVEHPKPASADVLGMRYGKAASAVELAQAFSRSISVSTSADRLSGQRVPSNGVQIPFSQLTGTTPRPRLNGY